MKETSLSIRTTTALKLALDAAAQASGRSRAKEIEHRLWRSFDRSDTENLVVGVLDAALTTFRGQLDELSVLVRQCHKTYRAAQLLGADGLGPGIGSLSRDEAQLEHEKARARQTDQLRADRVEASEEQPTPAEPSAAEPEPPKPPKAKSRRRA